MTIDERKNISVATNVVQNLILENRKKLSVSGVNDVSIGDTICTKDEIKALERITVDEPTVSMMFSSL